MNARDTWSLKRSKIPQSNKYQQKSRKLDAKHATLTEFSIVVPHQSISHVQVSEYNNKLFVSPRELYFICMLPGVSQIENQDQVLLENSVHSSCVRSLQTSKVASKWLDQ